MEYFTDEEPLSPRTINILQDIDLNPQPVDILLKKRKREKIDATTKDHQESTNSLSKKQKTDENARSISSLKVSHHTCELCQKIFKKKYNLKRHLKNIHQKCATRATGTSNVISLEIPTDENDEPMPVISTVASLDATCNVKPVSTSVKLHTCELCQKIFKRKYHLKRHLRSIHQKSATKATDSSKGTSLNIPTDENDGQASYPANEGLPTDENSEPISDTANMSPNAPSATNDELTTACSNASDSNENKGISSVFFSYRHTPEEEDACDIEKFLSCVHTLVTNNLQFELERKGNIKWHVVLVCRFARTGSDGEDEYTVSYFRSECEREMSSNSISDHISKAFNKVKTSFEEFEKNGSGWVLDKIIELDVKIAQYKPLYGSSYMRLPQKVYNTKSVINVHNSDQKCFIWSVLAALYPATSHVNRVSNYEPYEKELNTSHLSYPVTFNQISRFEIDNKLGINIFGWEEELFPLRITDSCYETVINLLLISQEEKRHFCLIKNFNRLLSHLTKYKGQSFYCMYCLHRFSNKDRLENHTNICKKQEVQKIRLPEGKDAILKFKNHRFQLPVPFVIYADFESLLVPVQGCKNENDNTQVISKHVACGYAYIIIGPDGKSVQQPIVYRGENAVDSFLEAMLQESKKILNVLDDIKPINMTSLDEQVFDRTEKCHICEKKITERKVRDHNHLNAGENFVGAACNSCNLNYKLSKKIPVIIHNLKSYDGHLIMQHIGKIKKKKIECIAINMEKYITFSLGHLQFLDSCQFLNASLEKLVQNLNNDQFVILKEHFTSSEVELLRRKGIYPYTYMDSFSRFEETQLPHRENFFNDLTKEELRQNDYDHALNVWKIFKIKNMGNYHDLYVKSDVLLLADVFQNFRNLSINFYKIDPCHLFTAPGLAWQACLRMTGVELELLTDPDMLLFFEQGIRGGISTISNRYSKANNKYLSDFDVNKISSYIIYLDMNNLYGAAMVESLPIGNFQWISPCSISEQDILNTPDDGETGYILKVNLLYPEHLHHSHNDYPLAPEKMKITQEIISPYSKELAKELGSCSNSEKLVPNLMTKTDYIIDYRNLKLYVHLGMKIVKISKILSYKQQPWLKPFIEFNTEKRKVAKNSFEKDFFKLMNNAVYGKSMENLRNRFNLSLVKDEKSAKRLVASPAYHDFKVFSNDLVAVQRKNINIMMNRPIYTGFTILERSKKLMYSFHYEKIKSKYGDNAKLLFTDTDSLCYEIKTDDIYDDMMASKELYDTSEYPRDHKLYSEANKKIIGKMKDELNGHVALEFIGLRSKMYSLKTLDYEKKTAKGVSKSVLKKQIKHENYKECLFRRTRQKEEMTRIASEGHILRTVTCKKISLCPMDDKRFILDNGTDTLAYGHYEINK